MSSKNNWRTSSSNPFFVNTPRARWTTALIMAVLVCGAASSGFIVGLIAGPSGTPPATATRDQAPAPPPAPAQAAIATPPASQTADASGLEKELADCEKQTWPYIDRTCAERLQAMKKTRQVRVIGGDPNTTPSVMSSATPSETRAPKPAATPAPTTAPPPPTATAAQPAIPALAEQLQLSPPPQTTGGPSVMAAVTAPFPGEMQSANAEPFPPAATASLPANATQETTEPAGPPETKNASDTAQGKKAAEQKRKTARVKRAPVDRQDTAARDAGARDTGWRDDEGDNTRTIVVRDGSGRPRTIVVRGSDRAEGKRVIVDENGRPRGRRDGVRFADEPVTEPQPRERPGGFLSDLFNFGNRGGWND